VTFSTPPKSPRDVLKERLVAVALESAEFSAALSDAAVEIRSGAIATATEATIAGYFERVLYATLRDIGLRFHPEKEIVVDTERHVGRGRIDARLGAVVIEYKKPLRFKTDADVKSAIEQIGNYLTSLSRQDMSSYCGFVTDGRRFVEVRATAGRVTSSTAPAKLTSSALGRLARAISALRLAALTAENLIRDFAGADNRGVLFDAARTFFRALNAADVPKTKMLHSEWEVLFRLGHTDRSQQRRIEERRNAMSDLFGERLKDSASEYRALFALHTAYALVVKLMAFRVVSELALGRTLTNWGAQQVAETRALRAFCLQLEGGEIFRKLGILNLLEGDFFSWYCDETQWTEEIAAAVRSIFETLGTYEGAAKLFSSFGAVDLFRDLYEASVPQPVRSSLGEFYTPSWLAHHVLESSGVTGNWRVIDPCCGSGTFVIACIERIRDERRGRAKRVLLKEILERVVGVDLNPLAVLATRVNYFIHIADLLSENPDEFVIPVFLGDATYVQSDIEVDGVPCLFHRLATLSRPVEVTLPTALVEDTPRFVKAMVVFEKAIAKRNGPKAAKALLDCTPPSALTAEVKRRIHDLASELVALETSGWDGIWARIITNFLCTAALGRFDAVVGNPPWIDWKNLPTGYRDRVKSLCIDRGIFSGDGRTGGINLNVCALISHVAAARWLLPSGRLAFLMPRELSVQQSYQGWRCWPRRHFELFHDWTRAGHPFEPIKEDFMTYVIGPKRPRGGVVPVREHVRRAGDRTRAKDWRSADDAMAHLDERRSVAGQVIPGSSAFTFATTRSELDDFRLIAGDCSYIGREGIEFYPQELLLFRYDRPGPKPGTVFVRNIQAQKSKYKIPEQTVLLETKYLFPLVKARPLNSSGMCTTGSWFFSRTT
jgi:N-6 DNA Methylase